MKTLEEILREYLRVLGQHGSMTPRVLEGLDPATDWNAMRFPSDATAFDDLKTYFRVINGDNAEACNELDIFEPRLAWGMHTLSLTESVEHHELAGEYPDYWPSGFMPILMDGAGSYVVVNCVAASPTFRSVYDMSDGVGCTRIANSLSEFFAASTQEVLLGLRNHSVEDVAEIEARLYLEKAAPLFGHSPYFDRNRRDQPVVDWQSDTPPQPYERRTTPSGTTPASPEIVRWANIAGVATPGEDGSYQIRLSTAPVEQWFFQKSKLTSQTTSIEADIRRAMWTVKLIRQDDLFIVIWSSGGKISVNSDQLKYQRLVRWPPLDAIENFPTLVKKIESLLGLQFVPYADVTVPYTQTQATLVNPQLIAWLAPCAKKIGRYIGGSKTQS